MTSFQDRFFRAADGLELYVRNYPGPAGATAAVCLHGLTRNSADFEDVAPRLAASRRVLVPDMRGRGRSQRDLDPGNYSLPVYVADLRALLAAMDIPRCIVVGTSMGGLIGMLFGAAAPDMLAGLVLNDIGPEIDPAGLARIAGYVGKGEPLPDWQAATEANRAANGIAFPDLAEEDWERFARRSFREDAEGRIWPDYDPAIALGLASGDAAPPDLWPMFEQLADIPLLVVRGAMSDILADDTLERMRERHPACETVTVPGRGHAPMLDEPAARAALDAWLARIG